MSKKGLEEIIKSLLESLIDDDKECNCLKCRCVKAIDKEIESLVDGQPKEQEEAKKITKERFSDDARTFSKVCSNLKAQSEKALKFAIDEYISCYLGDREAQILLKEDDQK